MKGVFSRALFLVLRFFFAILKVEATITAGRGISCVFTETLTSETVFCSCCFFLSICCFLIVGGGGDQVRVKNTIKLRQ